MHLAIAVCFVIAVRSAPQESPVEKAAGEILIADALKTPGDTSNVDVEQSPSETLNIITINKKAVRKTINIDLEKATDEALNKGAEMSDDDKLNAEAEDSSNDEDRSVLAYSINSYHFKLPKGLFREVMYTNDWIWFLKYPEYSLDFHYYCPYDIEDGNDIEPGDLELCLSIVDLNYWSEIHDREILLDTFNITWADGSEDLAERSVVLSEPLGEIHTVELAMSDGICKQMKYTITSTFEVVPSVEDIDCELVKIRKIKNDNWALNNLPELAQLDEEGTVQNEDYEVTKERLMISATEGLSTARSVTVSDLSNYIKSLVATTSSAEPDGSVISSNYRLPKGLYKEFPIANNWILIKSPSIYFLNYFLYCPFQLKLHKQVWTRRVRFLGCQSVIRLTKYFDLLGQDVILDSFHVKQRYITSGLIDALKVHADNGKKTEVLVKLVDNKCTKNIYEMQTDGSVKREEIDIACPEKEQVQTDKAVEGAHSG